MLHFNTLIKYKTINSYLNKETAMDIFFKYNKYTIVVTIMNLLIYYFIFVHIFCIFHFFYSKHHRPYQFSVYHKDKIDGDHVANICSAGTVCNFY